MDEKKAALKSIRESFLFFGHDTSQLTGEELEERIIEGSKTIASYGVTVNEATEYLTLALKTLNN
jgi:hypothetical protein